ncbi:MAG: ATP synthase F1 subunit delta [Bacteroidales bacterium]
MNEAKIGKRYAKALFDFALEQNDLEQVSKDIILVDNTIQQNRELKKLLKNPVIHNKTKKSIVRAVFQKYAGEIVLNYLMIIVGKNRSQYISDITTQFVLYYKKYQNIKTAHLSTAVQINDAIRKAIIQTLEEQTKANIELKENINEDLIGGMILKLDNLEIDMSMRKRINELANRFTVNIYQGKL